ncbi:MAG TPA: isoprenylcysteine carboxylmethyltransferase family protein [Bacillota bacterium]|nr:isoprenylcysteine carboxylmethyltransferase family protein [Bacillota bacterium]
MPKVLLVLLIFIALQRITELMIAKRNEQWMKKRGGIERGKEHYKWFVIVHTLFFLSILLEVDLRDYSGFKINLLLLTIFVLLQIARVWCITSLGRFWNTKIIILPSELLVEKGPYKYVKHPNYIIVGLELFFIPLLFNAYVTALIFPILHLLLMTIRIPIENKALAEVEKGL